MSRLGKILGAVAAVSTILITASAQAQEVKHYRFAYDQPRNTGYSVAGDLFAEKLKQLQRKDIKRQPPAKGFYVDHRDQAPRHHQAERQRQQGGDQRDRHGL